MLIRIDVTHCRFVVAGERPPADSRLIEGEAKLSATYSKLTRTELAELYRNCTGYVYAGDDYNALLQACKTLGLHFLGDRLR